MRPFHTQCYTLAPFRCHLRGCRYLHTGFISGRFCVLQVAGPCVLLAGRRLSLAFEV